MIDYQYKKPVPVKPANATEFGMYMDGQWYRLSIKPELVPDDPVASLDVSLTDREKHVMYCKDRNYRNNDNTFYIGHYIDRRAKQY